MPFRHLHDCSGCFRLERFAGWGSHPLESAAFSRRTRKAGIAAWDLSNATTVDSVLIKMVAEKAKPEAIEESFRRRGEWTDSLIGRILATGCSVDIQDGVAKISHL